jgi:succinate dehydrogenase/fumarate reductase-like Fe-S protein
MKTLEKPHRVWSCKTYYRCMQVCPKNIKATEAILKTKKKIKQLHSNKEKETN